MGNLLNPGVKPSYPGESSQPRDQSQVSCIAGRFFTIWATREALAKAGDEGSNPWVRRSLERNGNPLQFFCLENPMDRGAWWAAVHRASKSHTWLSRLSMHALPSEKRSPENLRIIRLQIFLERGGFYRNFILCSTWRWPSPDTPCL